jgi:hypothetical protein
MTKAELLARISSHELSEWMAVFTVEAEMRGDIPAPPHGTETPDHVALSRSIRAAFGG